MKYAFGLFILSTITLSTTASTKPGCPPIDPRIRCIHFHEQCKSDSECKPGQLCCGHTCGTNCMEPFPLPPSQPNTCWLPKDKGPCKALIPRFYYDSNTYKCRKFIYGGCKGNANNFKTKKECNQECKKSVCTLPMDPGPCKGSFKKWYYNVATGKCEKFIYGGCKGNGNRFNRKRGCMKNCKGVKPTPPPSPSPPPPPPTDPVKSKPGLCPKPSGRPGICVEGCGGDFNCPGYQKCCSNGCGHVCTNPAGPSPSPPPPPPFPPHSICEKGTPFPNINCGFGSGRNPCPRGYYCKTEATDHYAVCCQNPCSYGRPHSTLSCGMVIGSNKCPNGYSCVAGAADEFFACCPTRPSPSPPPPPPPPPPFPPQSICEKGTPFPNINCGLGPASKTCPRSYYCKTHPTDHYAVCCQNPCSYGVPHPTLSCGMVIGSNRCPTGYSCVAGAADDFFACCPTKPSPSPPPPPTPPGKSKPGSCPKPKSGTAGICLQRCNGDFDCRGNEKCCSNGCGNECLDPEVPPSSTQLPPFPSSVCERGTQLPNLNCGLRPCPRGYYCKFDPTKSLRVCCRNPCSIGIPNTKLKCGLVVGSNKCTNGYSCVPGPADEPPVCCQTRKTKPGSCPIPKSEMAGICLQRCNGDFDCRGNAKCCSNGCGNECSNPEDNVPKCRIGQPLSNIFCGRGRNRQDCPKGYSCNIHPTDKYAVCCQNDNVPICRLGQPLSNINCGRGPNRQNCPKGYYCNIHPTDKYAVCCRNGNIYVEYVDSPTIRFE